MIGSLKNTVLASLLSFSLLGFTQTLFADGSLSFVLNNNREIISCESFEGMAFAGNPETYTGKDVLEIVPLSPEDKAELLRNFEIAGQLQEARRVFYKLDGKTFIADILPQGLEGEYEAFVYLDIDATGVFYFEDKFPVSTQGFFVNVYEQEP